MSLVMQKMPRNEKCIKFMKCVTTCSHDSDQLGLDDLTLIWAIKLMFELE